jgi:hypothetical protein
MVGRSESITRNLIQWFERRKLLIPIGLFFLNLAYFRHPKECLNGRQDLMVKGLTLISAHFLDLVGAGGSSPLGCTKLFNKNSYLRSFFYI